MTIDLISLEQSELGKKARYDSHYDSSKLFAIPRKAKRDELGIVGGLPFFGFDIWNHYEVSWLNEKGKPMVAMAEIIYGCDSKNIIESKSMKLYFNSFNNTRFKDAEAVEAIIKKDLEDRVVGSLVMVRVTPLKLIGGQQGCSSFSGECLDELDIECSVYHAAPELLKTEDGVVEETLCSNLLKSNCLVTHQPDWCSVQIAYRGKKINHEGLLRYIVSFRNDNEFHEPCIEKIFMDIKRSCNPYDLTVYGRSTRRGGLDINAYRSTKSIEPLAIANGRLCRQ